MPGPTFGGLTFNDPCWKKIFMVHSASHFGKISSGDFRENIPYMYKMEKV